MPSSPANLEGLCWHLGCGSYFPFCNNFSSYFFYSLVDRRITSFLSKGARKSCCSGPFYQWMKTGQTFSSWLPSAEEAVITKCMCIQNIFLFNLRNNIHLGAQIGQQGQGQALHFVYECLYSPALLVSVKKQTPRANLDSFVWLFLLSVGPCVRMVSQDVFIHSSMLWWLFGECTQGDSQITPWQHLQQYQL